MADLRITPGSQALVSPALKPVQPAGRADAVKDAQRAFFTAALTQAQAQPEVKRVAVTAPVVAERVTTRLHATVDSQSAPPERMLRPGSLLDIKV